MANQQGLKHSLQDRVSEYLSGRPAHYAPDESEAAVAEALHQALIRAEKDLEAAQQRVDRLRWELEKARS